MASGPQGNSPQSLGDLCHFPPHSHVWKWLSLSDTGGLFLVGTAEPDENLSVVCICQPPAPHTRSREQILIYPVQFHKGQQSLKLPPSAFALLFPRGPVTPSRSSLPAMWDISASGALLACTEGHTSASFHNGGTSHSLWSCRNWGLELVTLCSASHYTSSASSSQVKGQAMWLIR